MARSGSWTPPTCARPSSPSELAGATEPRGNALDFTDDLDQSDGIVELGGGPRWSRRAAGTALLLVSVLALPTAPAADAHFYYKVNGNEYHWGDHPNTSSRRLSFYNETGHATWNQVTNEWCSNYRGYSDYWRARGIDMPEVFCFTSGGLPGSGNQDWGVDFTLASLAGYTGEGGYTSVIDSVHHAFRGVVRIDPTKPLVSTLDGKRAVFCHEMGHALGLAHAHSANDSCMRDPANAAVRWYNCHDDCYTWRPMYQGHPS